MTFTRQDVGVVVYGVSFAVLSTSLAYFSKTTKFDMFHAAVIAIFISSFAGFQLLFYTFVEAKVPGKVTTTLLDYFLQILPDAKAKLQASNTLTAEEYNVKASQLKTDNKNVILGSSLFKFVMINAGLSLLFVLIYIQPFTARFKLLSWPDIKIMGIWLSTALLQVLLFVLVAQRHTYIYKAQIFEYGLQVLRNSVMSTVISQARANPSVVPAADLEKVSGNLNSIINAQQKIDLDIDNMPSIARRFKDLSNTHVIILACLSVVTVAYTVFSLIISNNKGSALSIIIFLAVMSYYMFLYTSTKTVNIKTTLDDPDMLLYDISQSK